MVIIYSPTFKRHYRKLPDETQSLAEEKEKTFRINPFARELKTHKLSGKHKNLWAFSVGYKHRIIFRFNGTDSVIFLGMGDHKIYR